MPPSTLGSFLREFSFGHVRQLDAVAARLLTGLAENTPLAAGIEGPVCVDIDDTIIEVHGYVKQGSGYGYSGVRGLNALLTTVTTEHGAPVITGQRLRKGACGSARGAARMIGDTLATVQRLRSAEATGKPLVRMDSAFYGYPSVAAANRGGADVSVTVRLDPKVKAAIAQIPDHTWTAIEYTDAIYDENTHQWISRAEVAEIELPRSAPARPPSRSRAGWWCAASPTSTPHGQQSLFDIWRFHAFFTTTDLDTVTADKTHRGHAIIEQVHADLKDSALAHLPSGRFNANAAWLVLAVMAFNLTRAAATHTGPRLALARTATIRRTLISVPARSRPRLAASPCTYRGTGPGNRNGTSCSTVSLADISRSSPNPAPRSSLDTKDPEEQPDTEVRRSSTPVQRHTRPQGAQSNSTSHRRPIGGLRLSSQRRRDFD